MKNTFDQNDNKMFDMHYVQTFGLRVLGFRK